MSVHWYKSQETAHKNIAKRLSTIEQKVDSLLNNKWDHLGNNTRDKLITMRMELRIMADVYRKAIKD